jgi:hypothetical protein
MLAQFYSCFLFRLYLGSVFNCNYPKKHQSVCCEFLSGFDWFLAADTHLQVLYVHNITEISFVNVVFCWTRYCVPPVAVNIIINDFF